jgi:alpha-beta hydrolase superfamily lysophospholipase
VHRASARALAALVLALSTTALGATAAGASVGSGSGDTTDFYAVPDPLPKALPGSLIRAASIDAPDGAKAWRVLYHSTTVDGRDIAVSGVVVAPEGPPPKGGRPVLSWAHGTTGIADACAPSMDPEVASRLPFVEDFLDAGYVIAATDYEGLGTPGVHPYLVGESEGRGVLDAARAARRLDGTGAGRELLVFGHSQGGHAALFAGELKADYAPELRLRGVVAGAPAANVEIIFPGAARVPRAAGFTALIAKGFEAAYPDADPASLLSPEVLAAAQVADTGCALDVIDAVGKVGSTDLVGDLASTPPWPDILRENSAGHRAAGAPLLVVQGTADQVVPAALTDAWVGQACAAGDVVEYRSYEGKDHITVLGEARAGILEWLATLAQGDAVRDTCPTP